MALDTLDIALDQSSNDILLQNDRFQLISGINFLMQNLKVRLQWFIGEWYLNTSLGISYFQDVLIKNPNETLIKHIFTKVILTTPNITGLKSFSFSVIDSTNRIGRINFTVITDYGVATFNEDLSL